MEIEEFIEKTPTEFSEKLNIRKLYYTILENNNETLNFSHILNQRTKLLEKFSDDYNLSEIDYNNYVDTFIYEVIVLNSNNNSTISYFQQNNPNLYLIIADNILTELIFTLENPNQTTFDKLSVMIHQKLEKIIWSISFVGAKLLSVSYNIKTHSKILIYIKQLKCEIERVAQNNQTNRQVDIFKIFNICGEICKLN